MDDKQVIYLCGLIREYIHISKGKHFSETSGDYYFLEFCLNFKEILRIGLVSKE